MRNATENFRIFSQNFHSLETLVLTYTHAYSFCLFLLSIPSVYSFCLFLLPTPSAYSFCLFLLSIPSAYSFCLLLLPIPSVYFTAHGMCSQPFLLPNLAKSSHEQIYRYKVLSSKSENNPRF